MIAMTITLAAVFTPLSFAQGNTGKLMTEFALTVATSVIVSGFVALSLVPMMCSRLLKHDHSLVYRKTEPFFQGMTNGYRAALRGLLTTPLFQVPWFRRRVLRFDSRIFVGLVFVLVIGAGVWLFLQLRAELSPEEDRSLFLAFVIAPEGSSMQYTDSYMHAVEEIAKGVPEIDTMFAVVAPGLERPNPVNLGIAFAVLKPWAERKRSQQEITKELGPKLYGGLPGALSFVKGLPPLGQPLFSKRVEYVIYGNTYEELQGKVNKIMAKLSQYPGITGLDTDLKLNKPQLAVKIDRDKAAALGISMEAIGHTLETLLGGFDVTRYKHEGKQYDVVVQMEDDKRRQPSDLTSIYVRGADGSLNQLSNLVSLSEIVAPKELNHFNKLRAAVINGEPAGQCQSGPGAGAHRRFGQDRAGLRYAHRPRQHLAGVQRIERAVVGHLRPGADRHLPGAVGSVRELHGPPGHHAHRAAGHDRRDTCHVDQRQAGARRNAQRLQSGRSRHAGGLDHQARDLDRGVRQPASRQRAWSEMDAVVEASTLRLRPILMTTAAMVLGAVPLALAHGAGAESRQAIGWVVVGGLLLGTLLTLFVIPTMYSMMVRKVRLPTFGGRGRHCASSRCRRLNAAASAPGALSRAVRARPRGLACPDDHERHCW